MRESDALVYSNENPTPFIARERRAEVLVADDSEDDVFLMQLAFRRSDLAVNLHHVENGKECLHFLRKENQYSAAPTPDLVLLDMQMPIMGGREVLQQITADDSLRHLPVIVLSTSAEPEDVRGMYALRCNSYIAKPYDFVEFAAVIQDLGSLWLSRFRLPGRD